MTKEFPEKEFLEAFVLDEFRETYNEMSREQKFIVRMAYIYGINERTFQENEN